MKDILEYVLKKLEDDLSHTETIYSLFSDKDNHSYRKTWYEIIAIQIKEKKGKVISFESFEKEQLEDLKREISLYKKMISEVKSKLNMKGFKEK